MKRISSKLFTSLFTVLCSLSISYQVDCQSMAGLNPNHFVTEHPNGVVDWTDQYIEATGVSFLNLDRFKNEKQAYQMAIRGAEVVAKANLLEIIEGISVYRETIVKDLMTESDIVRTQVEGKIKGARRVGDPVRDGDMVEVTVRIPLYGNNGIAPIMHESISARDPSLMENIPIIPERENKKNNNQSSKSGTDGAAQPQFVLNFKDGKFDPSLFPLILDEKGNIVLDMAKLYKSLPPDAIKYLDMGKVILDAVNLPKGVELVDAEQKDGGAIVIKTEKNPKFNKFLKDAVAVGKILLPIVLAFL